MENKKILLFFIIITTVLCCVSCGKMEEEELPEGAVPVVSSYPNLRYLLPGEFEYHDREDPQWHRYKFNTYVTTVNGSLALLANHAHDSGAVPHVWQSTQYEYGTIVGNSTGVYLKGELVIKQKCVGLLPSFSGDGVLIFTSDDKKGYIYAADWIDSEWQISDETIELDSPILFFYCNWNHENEQPPKEFYTVTEKGFYIFHVGDLLDYWDGDLSSVSQEIVSVPDYWSVIQPTGITQTEDGMIYIGELCGVIGIQLTDKTVIYYPINYFDANGKGERTVEG